MRFAYNSDQSATYRQEVERMNEKVEKLERAYMCVFVKEKTR